MTLIDFNEAGGIPGSSSLDVELHNRDLVNSLLQQMAETDGNAWAGEKKLFLGRFVGLATYHTQNQPTHPTTPRKAPRLSAFPK